jgi:hypothetical protein
MKAGGADVRVLRQPSTEKIVRADVEAVIRAQGEAIAGFAFVVWGADGGSTCGFRNFGNSPVMAPLLGDFVGKRLYAELVERWTRGGLREEDGWLPPA